MPLGYETFIIQHAVSGEVQEVYAAELSDYFDHPWFSQFYVIYNEFGYGNVGYGSGPYGNE